MLEHCSLFLGFPTSMSRVNLSHVSLRPKDEDQIFLVRLGWTWPRQRVSSLPEAPCEPLLNNIPMQDVEGLYFKDAFLTVSGIWRKSLSTLALYPVEHIPGTESAFSREEGSPGGWDQGKK